MSIKKLFESADKSRNYLAETNEKNAFKNVESADNVEQIAIKQNTFVPNIDYRHPENFAKFGSAYYYYSGAIGRLVDYYPYDGSDAEQNAFYNKSLDVEKFIFNNLYPRVNGYANFDSSSYIDFKGGPHGVTFSRASELFDNPLDSKRHSANVYDKNIYQTAGLPDSYGTGSRESNLRANFDSGVTVEFWLKSRDLAAGKTQVIFDMWNDNASGSHDMGRLTLEVHSASSGTPFKYTVQSGSTDSSVSSGPVWVTQEPIGQTITTSDLSDWNHYSFVFQNSGSNLVTKLYLNGYLNHTVITGSSVGQFPSKDMKGRIGALLTSPFRLDGTTTHLPGANAHTLTGSIDEFRFWKVARNSEDIGINWFTQVRGGTNTDISNTTLGVYYKFNEGNSGFGYLDKNVLDYSGRLTNGTWVGTPSRTLSSAIVESNAATSEYKDPIIYSQHPDVATLREGLFSSGSFHDKNNTSNLKTLMPSWILEEHEQLGNKNPELIAHIVGTYFDKIYCQIESLTEFKKLHYTSASAVPLPFAEHLPQSLGLYTPQLFVDSDVVSRFLNKTSEFKFENDLTETKNLIYLNLYNNLTNIYKTKGTEKAIKNVFRCFNLNDSIVKLKTYVDNDVFTLDSRLPRLQQTLTSKKALFFNTSSNVNGICYQFQDPDDTTGTRGYISGSGIGGYENKYGFTAEADFTLPAFDIDYDSVIRDFRVASIFGMYTASTEAPSTLTFPAYDGANFQVYAVRETKESKNVFFMLSSSYTPQIVPTNMPTGSGLYIPGTTNGPFPLLTSSIFFDAYDNNDWNLSVRLKPSNYPYAEILSGSDVFDTYDLVFQGFNTKLGVIENSFVVSASINKSTAQDFLSGSKRMYVGANRTNFTGDVRFKSDVRFFNTRYWGKYIDDDSIKQHIFDLDNSGISGSFKNISALDPNNDGYDILNRNLLVLEWNFSDVTSSDGSGNFLTQDMSSGSAQIRRGYGWVGGLSGFKHTGKGHGFKASSTSVSKQFNVNTFKFIEPEAPISSDAINILTSDDKFYGFPQTIPNFHYSLEKSLYSAVSDEILNFFAGAIDFNNIVGEPVNRYRSRYKKLEKLREAFFRKVTKTTQVEDYVKYYQWFDDSLSEIISQLMPASGRFSEDVFNVVESHALERNKYKSQFPTIEFKLDDPITPILGINERLYNWKFNHAPLSMSNGGNPELGIEPGVGGPLTGSELQKVNSKWWKERAERRGSHISSGNNDVDNERDNIRRSIENDNNQKLNVLVTLTNGVHSGSSYVLRKLSKPYKFYAYRTASPVPPIKGGVNFEQNKKIDFTYNALRPAGPINEEDDVFVPENVLFGNLFDPDTGKEIDFEKIRDSTDPDYRPYFSTKPNQKMHRRAKIQHGRNWEEGIGYQSIKSDFSFPFNIVSSSVKTGYNKLVDDRVVSGVMVTNLHNDVYGPDMESPMQGPFTNYAVGGHQSRHVALNKGTDSWDTRPEAWKLLLGKCDDILNVGARGAIGMVGPDYPLPNAPEDRLMYPHTASQKAVYYRDFVAKRPVNIKNIRHTTGSTILGNYDHNYQIVQAPGGFSNPRQFIERQPNLPILTFSASSDPSYTRALSSSTSIRTLLDIYRGARDGVFNVQTASALIDANGRPAHFDFSADYSTDYLQGGIGYATQPLGGQATTNNSVIISRFSAPGGIEIMSKGYQDFRSSEFTVYNMLNNRNLTVRRPFQNHPVISGAAEEDGYRVYDIHGNDYGLTVHAARHTERFFRDSILVPNNQGETYAEKPAFHRVHRNNLPRKKVLSETFIPVVDGPQNDNNQACYFVEPENYSSMLLSNETNGDAANGVASRFLSASRPSGFTYSGWIRLDPSTTRDNNGNAYLFGVGKAAGSSEPFVEISKTSASFAVEIQSRNATNFQGSSRRAEWNISTVGDNNATAQVDQLNLGNWVHLAVSVPVSAAFPGPAAPSVYINGVAQPVSEDTSPYNYWDPKQNTGTTNILGAVPRDGTSSFAFGRNPAKVASGLAQFGTSGAMDQISIWTTALSASEVTELYNGGIPCDVTSSQAYQNSASHLFAWYKMGEGSPHGNVDSVNTTNAKAFNSSSNAIYNFVRDEHHLFALSNNQQSNQGIVLTTGENGGTPSPLQGCQPSVLGYSSSITFQSCGQVYDNLNHYHPIPRSDRQYAWMTGAIADPDPCNVRYAGYMPVFGSNAGLFYSHTASTVGDFEPWMTMITASEYGSYFASGRRYYGIAEGQTDATYKEFIPVDFAGLNTIIYEPITSSTNTLGYPLGSLYDTGTGELEQTYKIPTFDSGLLNAANSYYMNHFIIERMADNNRPRVGQPAVLNAILHHRNGPYGYGTHAQFRRNPNHPVLRNERSSSEISVLTYAEHDVLDMTDFGAFPTGEVKRTWDITNFTLPPVSMRGRPAFLNYTSLSDIDDCGETTGLLPATITLKITDNNQKTYFNSFGLNTHTGVDSDAVLTPLDYTMAALTPSEGEDIGDVNWLIYSENVFPSVRMEFVSSSRRRTNFNNLFWRDSRNDRTVLGATLDTSCHVYINQDNVHPSQSSWPLDAQEDFLTRTASVVDGAARPGNVLIDLHTLASGSYLTAYGKAGELQNNFTQFHFDRTKAFDGVRDGWFSYSTVGIQNVPGPLYARKQMFAGLKSVTTGLVGMLIAETGSYSEPLNGGPNVNWESNEQFNRQVQTASGEAFWEAGTQAGIVSSSLKPGVIGLLGGMTHEFKSYESRPWYDNYQDFREQIRILAKDYAIVPEFRIHNIVTDLVALDPSEVRTVYEIPGTGIFDSTSSFFRDYTNTERMSYFKEVNSKTSMEPKEFRITVSAVKKFNPYKGFYPAQRTIDLVSQFKMSYFENITAQLQRVTDLNTKASTIDNYGNALNNFTSVTRPIMTPLFAPGILFNSIKSGMAVDFPVLEATVAKPNLIASFSITGAVYGSLHAYAGFENTSNTTSSRGGQGWKMESHIANFTASQIDNSKWDGGVFWDKRLPFETILDPASEMVNLKLSDLEVSPSSSIPYTASLSADGDPIYKLMARNFFGETANFFLKDGDFSSLRSQTVPEAGIMFTSGTYWGARIKMRRSMRNSRYYFNEWDSGGYRRSLPEQGGFNGGSAPLSVVLSSAFGATGGRRLLHNSGTNSPGLQFGGQEYPLPQDPAHHSGSRESFTMYSRTTAFGPPVAGRHPGGMDDWGTASTVVNQGRSSLKTALQESVSGALDCFTGHNWSFTPPYYHGEAWCDVLFFPDETRRWKVDEILNGLETVYWRADPGPEVLRERYDRKSAEFRTIRVPAFIPDYHNNVVKHAADLGDTSYIGGGRNVNKIAMQLSSSINLFGIERVAQTTANPAGAILETLNVTKGMRWNIKPKWETPHLNFNSPIRTISAASGTLTLPQNFGSGTVPRGMWHQFGIIDPDPNRGIFLEINDIPKDWLANHYKVVNENSVYNKYNSGFVTDPESNGNSVKNKMNSLTNIFGFNAVGHRRKLGQLASNRTVSEAVVVIPYIYPTTLNEPLVTHPELVTDDSLKTKAFFRIPDEKVRAAISANAFTADGTSIDTAGESVRKLIRKMDKYILPPEFDFLRNPNATPLVMYIFEFKHTFDKDDLSYMWQNLSPRNYKNIEFEEQSIAHALDSSELLDKDDLFDIVKPQDVRFMTFKVKQKAVGDYYKHVVEQASPSGTGLVYVGPNAVLQQGQSPFTRYQGLGINIDSNDGNFTPSMAGGGGGSGVNYELGEPTLNPGFNVNNDLVPGELLPATPNSQLYEAQYNWPYDYLSIVEAIKIDVDVLFDDESNRGRSILVEDSAVPGYTPPGSLLDPSDPYGGLTATSPIDLLGSSPMGPRRATPNVNPRTREKLDAVFNRINEPIFGFEPS